MTAPTTYAWEIAAENLRVKAGRRVAVDGVTLKMGRGVHGLLGPNGAGKTTLIRALATVLEHQGELNLLGGMEPRELRKRVGYLPQEFGHYKRFTAREFIAYVAWLKEMRDIPAATQRAIDRVGLADRADDRMKTLSGGMIRRVGIAQAIVNDPEILLLDEPTAGLDPAQRLRFRELLTEIGTDACVVVSTHLVEDVATACTDVVLLSQGKLVFQGTPDDLKNQGSEHHPGDSPIERGYSAVLGLPNRPGAW